MVELFQMFWAFFCIGGLTFGGGYAMLPMLTRYCVEKYHWTTEQDLLDYFALGQCTPGLIAVNTAAFVGFQRRRIPGVLACVLGVLAPSIIVIVLVAIVLEQVMEYPAVICAFSGIRIAVGALIMGTVIKLFKSSVKSVWHLLLCAAAFVASILKVSPVFIVLLAGGIGAALGRHIEKPALSILSKRGGNQK